MREVSRRRPDFSAVRGSRLVIALSGGADSVALAVMLAEARDLDNLTLFAAHVDHAIRPESAEDALWCRELCARLDIPFHTVRFDVPAEAARTGEGLETAGRRLRYDWLRGLKGELGADAIALAHHMDDQAETVLMHLARGTGPEGIAGMAERSGDLYRPLLSWRKSELTDYLARRGFSWREDATNAVPDTPRNALRLNVLPALEDAYPGAVPAIARYARSARLESDFVAEAAARWLAANHVRGPYGSLLTSPEKAHPALLRRALRQLCGTDTPWERLNAAATLAEAGRGREELSGGWMAERGRMGLYLLDRAARPPEPVPLALPGSTALPGVCEITARFVPPVPVRDDPLRQVLDVDALEGAVLRTRREGDRIRPLGCGEKLLSDYFTDRKLDRPLRDWTPLLARGRNILWVCGMGISQSAAIGEGTRRAVALTCCYSYKTQPTDK